MTSLDATSTTLVSQEAPGRSFDEEQVPRVVLASLE
jgi:hypothetical protein